MEGVSRSFHTIWTIAKQEFSMYWISPIAYLVGAVWLFFSGLFFSLTLEELNSGGFGFGPTAPSMAGTLQPMAFLIIFLAPALTMRLVSDEIRSGTHELLLTAPVHDWEIILGKWLGVWGVFTVIILISLIYPFILAWRGSPDQGTMITGYLGYWLWSGAVLAVGVLASSLTQFQILSYIAGFFGTLMLFLAAILSQIITNPTINDVLDQLTLRSHYYNSMLNQGLLDPVDIAYFVGLIAICLFLATQMLSSRRWRA